MVPAPFDTFHYPCGVSISVNDTVAHYTKPSNIQETQVGIVKQFYVPENMGDAEATNQLVWVAIEYANGAHALILMLDILYGYLTGIPLMEYCLWRSDYCP